MRGGRRWDSSYPLSLKLSFSIVRILAKSRRTGLYGRSGRTIHRLLVQNIPKGAVKVLVLHAAYILNKAVIVSAVIRAQLSRI